MLTYHNAKSAEKKSFLLTNYIVCGLSLYKVVKIGYERLATSSIDLLGPRKLRES